MKLVAQNINLKSVSQSSYWELIAILVWGHYKEKRYQDERDVSFSEIWYGKEECGGLGGSFSSKWNNPEYSEPGYIRSLHAIKIEFERSDLTTIIMLYCDGNINCFGYYKDKNKVEKGEFPTYEGAKRNLTLTNWMLKNNLLKISNEEEKELE